MNYTKEMINDAALNSERELRERQIHKLYFDGLTEIEGIVARELCCRDNLTTVEIWGLQNRAKAVVSLVTKYLEGITPTQH